MVRGSVRAEGMNEGIEGGGRYDEPNKTIMLDFLKNNKRENDELFSFFDF